MSRSLIDEIIGWYGAAAIVLGYALTSFGAMATTSIWYQLLNATGALGIVYISFKKKAYPPGVLNIVWTIIAVIAIIRIIW